MEELGFEREVEFLRCELGRASHWVAEAAAGNYRLASWQAVSPNDNGSEVLVLEFRRVEPQTKK